VRIALVSTHLATDRHSGLARATRDLAGQLHVQEHAVTVVTEPSPDGTGLPAGVEVFEIAAAPPLEQAAAVHGALAALHRAGRLDIALVPLWGGIGALAVRDPRFPTVVSCLTTQRTMARVNPSWAAGPGRELERLERFCIEGARHLHGLTGAVLEDVRADYGGSPLTSAVVPRGLRDRSAGPAPHRAEGPLRLLFVGRLERRKGVDVLLEAVTALVREGHDVRLELAGPDSTLTEADSTYREAFERTAEPALAERVSFLGAVSDERLHELYGAADVVCQPSRYESHGIVLVEAMMFGKPIATASAGGIPEVVENGGNALLAEPGDPLDLAASLRTLVGSESLRARMAARSRELFLARFEIAAVARAMCDLFSEAIRAHEASPAGDSAAGLLAVALDARAAAAEDRLAELTRSRSWSLTRPLRELAARSRRE
jgi:glycogen(starch) synthase